MQPLDRILPHLDVYVPSHNEATHQTGLTDPREIIETYRACGAPGLLGVKLGAKAPCSARRPASMSRSRGRRRGRSSTPPGPATASMPGC